MVFCFVQKCFFGQHESQNIYLCCRLSHKARNLFPEFNIRLYDKNSDFFQQHWESEYFLKKKTQPPPFKLNGRSLMLYFLTQLHILTENSPAMIRKLLYDRFNNTRTFSYVYMYICPSCNILVMFNFITEIVKMCH